MAEKEVSLYEAFMLRNDIKEQLNLAKNRVFDNLSYLENEDSNFIENTKKKFGDSYKTVEDSLNSLEIINNIIENANIENKKLIYKIDTINSMITFLTDLSNKIRYLPKFETEYNKDSVPVKIKNSILMDSDNIQDIIQRLKLDKREVEKELNSSNARIKVTIPFYDSPKNEETE
jgi:hypothetical protein